MNCAAVPLPTVNNARERTASARVTVTPLRGDASPTDARRLGVPATSAAGTLIALAGSPSSGAGTFTASSLAPSSSWSHGGSTGGFQWSYPMRTPAGPGGPSPSLGLSYASQSVDGRHAATNNQPGAIGEGFDYSPGFIERQYKSCADDMDGNANNSEKTGDLCWGPDNAVMSLGGSSMELLKGSDGKWHSRREDGSKIERLTTPAYNNGDNDDEYWKVTTADGTQYWFGRHQLPGWSASRPTTNSVLTVPVFGNNPGEPCYSSTFASSDCNGKRQAWRWNLDYVQDIHGNTMSYWWTKETNYYAKNKSTTELASYDRGAYLTRIDYGTDSRDNTEYTTISPYVQNAPVRVEFTNSDRCLSNCTTKNATTWPDTPWDQECFANQTNPLCLNASPTFWSAKRLTAATTKVWKGAAYQDVDSWTLRQSFPDPGDGTRAGLWLDGITHRGLNGTALTAPEVTFSGVQMPNRVDASGSDWALAMNWRRVNSITLETGGEIYVTYSARQCAKGGTMPSPDALDDNSVRCYPVKWTPPSYNDPITDYFHKYVVTEVQQIDHTGGARPVRTAYEYPNPTNQPLWHFDEDNGLAPANRKTWSQWRGYPTVITYLGEGTERTKTETLYFRGMYGDKLAAGGTRTTTVQGREGGPTNDWDHYAGTPREQVTWLGGQIVSATLNEMWRSDPATATRTGTPIAEARYAGVKKVRTRTAVGSTMRRTTTTTNYDNTYGVPTSVEDGGDDAKTGDENCVQTEYARNTTGTNWLLTPVKRVHGWAGLCVTAPTQEQQITSDTRFSFDSLAYGTAPTAGKITKTESIKSFNAGVRAYQVVATAAYDGYGRVTQTTDVAGEITKTDYTPSTGGPIIKVVTTNPLDWQTTAELDPALGLPVKTTDTNGRFTEYSYDALGRNTGVWLPGRAKASFPADPSTSYTYTLSKTSISTVTTKAINARGSFNTTHALIDALGRPRQTQESGYGGGRVMTDTFYDAAGRIRKTNSAYYNSGAVDLTKIESPLDQDVPSQSQTLYDTVGRPTATLLLGSQASVQVEKARVSTTYHGDHVTVLPATGEAATTVWTDALGRTEKLWKYHGQTATGGYDETTYTYHPTGQLATVSDASGNTWTYTYDLQGRLAAATDPDKGAATLQYNTLGDLEKTTDSRADTPDLWYTYDRLGRPTTVREGSLTGPKRVENTYDLPVKGVTKSSSRWIGSDEYRDEIVTVDAQYRPTQTKLTLPASQATFCGAGSTTCSFTSKATYNPDGSPNTITLPAGGGLEEEKLTYEYDQTYTMPYRLSTDYGDQTYYVIDAGYTNLYEASTITRSAELTGTKSVKSSNYYDEISGRVKNSAVIRSTAPSYITNTFYEYDASGNVTKIDDNSGTRPRDAQCFTYDHQRRLTEAWTPISADCTDGTFTESDLGGPAPYWQKWEFGTPDDPKGRIGNRQTQIEKATPTGTVTTSYNYPDPGNPQPHRLDGWSRTDAVGTTTGTYTYDDAGNTKTRPGPAGQQTLTWDVEGHLAALADSAGNNSYTYDASGSRLIATDPTGSTLFLGNTEIRRNTATGSLTATRYYAFNEETVAQRSVTGVAWLASDHQGTSQITVSNDANQTITQRRQTPYGSSRGNAVTWPNKQGFLGGYQDPTGLTHLGAREYDPHAGRFISVDPINDPGNPAQLPAYTYAANNPITYSDPSGEIIAEYAGVDTPVGLCPHQKDGYACQEYIEGGGDKYKGPKRRSGSEKGHDFLDICGIAFGPIGSFCDAANVSWYIGEGYYTSAAVSAISMVPILDIGCKIKFVCKNGVEWIAGKAQKLIGKSPVGTAPTVNPAAAAKDSAKAAAETAKDLPRPSTPAPPAKTPAPKAKGKTAGETGGGAPSVKTGCKAHSFAPDTRVLMADGSTRPIGEISEGDQVLAEDPRTGRTSKQTVEKVHLNQDEDLTDLSIRTADGTFSTISTTQHHPVWSDSRNQWLDASELQPTERLRTQRSETATVARVHNYADSRLMRDLSVSNIHTYYVVAGNTPVLVHNCGGSLTVHKWAAEEPGGVPHFSAEVVADSGATRHTELLGGTGTPASVRDFDPVGMTLIESRTIRIPDAAGAITFQKRAVMRGRAGSYNVITNSCVTHCMNVAAAGGVGSVGVRDFASNFGWSYKDLRR
ncbi:RHS repeat-associated core domain-containing protein [Micromonospora rifamycinica]|uniref:RHS repeat-associated core domain-containing protein n=1 Tax=Micromonospora rifamycinica TaxID=291594 RepID=UPI0034232135